MPREGDGVGQCRGAGGGDDPVGGDGAGEQRVEPAGAFRDRERLALARRPEGRDAIDSVRQEPVRMSSEASVIDAAIASERRQHRAPEAADGVSWCVIGRLMRCRSKGGALSTRAGEAWRDS